MNLAALPLAGHATFSDVGGNAFVPGAASGSSEGALLAVTGGVAHSMSFADIQGASLVGPEDAAPLPQGQGSGTGGASGQRTGQTGKRRLAARPSDAAEKDDPRNGHHTLSLPIHVGQPHITWTMVMSCILGVGYMAGTLASGMFVDTIHC